MSGISDRFFALVEKTDDCWLWQGKPDVRGYGKLHVLGRQHPAHRIAYELFVGPIEDGLIVHHTCENRLCVNPDHLRAMTRGEHITVVHHIRDHVRRGPRTTTCRHGHLKVMRSGRMKCRVCERRWSKKHYEANHVGD